MRIIGYWSVFIHAHNRNSTYNRLIEQGKATKDKPLSVIDRVKKKWPAILVLGIIIGLIVKYVNGCNAFISSFTNSYLIWVIVDWYMI